MSPRRSLSLVGDGLGAGVVAADGVSVAFDTVGLSSLLSPQAVSVASRQAASRAVVRRHCRDGVSAAGAYGDVAAR